MRQPFVAPLLVQTTANRTGAKDRGAFQRPSLQASMLVLAYMVVQISRESPGAKTAPQPLLNSPEGGGG